jgi:hypothetical protein
MNGRLQKLFPDIHSDRVVLAARAIPTDIALDLSDGQLIALTSNIIMAMDYAVGQSVQPTGAKRILRTGAKRRHFG